MDLVYACLKSQILMLETTLDETECLAQGLDRLSVPVEKLGQPSFDELRNYRDSTFRKVQFQFQKNPVVSHPFLESQKGKKITYENLCTLVREYIYKNGLMRDGGVIQCDAFLQQICRAETTTFIGLLQNFNRIIQ